MTCIVAIRTDDYVYLGTDSFGSNSFTGSKISYPRKVFQVGDFIIGVCGSFRMIQILTHKFAVMPRFVDQDIYEYVYTSFYDSFISCLRQEKFLTDVNNVEVMGGGSELIIGIENKIFVMQGDLSIIEPADDFVCIGSGEYHSQAVLESLKDSKLAPAEKILRAIQKTSKYVLSVNEDVFIMTNDEEAANSEGLMDLDDKKSEDEEGDEANDDKPKKKRGRKSKKQKAEEESLALAEEVRIALQLQMQNELDEKKEAKREKRIKKKLDKLINPNDDSEEINLN